MSVTAGVQGGERYREKEERKRELGMKNEGETPGGDRGGGVRRAGQDSPKDSLPSQAVPTQMANLTISDAGLPHMQSKLPGSQAESIQAEL